MEIKALNCRVEELHNLGPTIHEREAKHGFSQGNNVTNNRTSLTAQVLEIHASSCLGFVRLGGTEPHLRRARGLKAEHPASLCDC